MFSAADSDSISQAASLKENSSSSTSDVKDSDRESQITRTQNREITLKMLVRELLICTALALTTYGALNNTPPKISKHPEAKRFFSKSSVVFDWYDGQLDRALEVADKADVAFILYYAPWDAESQYVRGEFEKAANILGDRVHFSAINCWHPSGTCRKHTKVSVWPILSANVIHSKPFLYKGPKEALYMVKFLELVMTPLKRITSAKDLVNLMSVCDLVAVGYTPLSDTPKYYNIWNSVAIQARGYDVVGEICFAVVTSEELAIDLGVETLPSIKYMMWNQTKEYDTGIQNWNASMILPWILANFRQPAEWIIPSWTKSYDFERKANGYPILIMFTPLNPLYEQIPMYALLREISIEYYNCVENKWLNELVKLKQIRRLIYQQMDVDKFCSKFKKKTLKKREKMFKVLSHQNKYPWTNTSLKTDKMNVFGDLFKNGFVFESLSGTDGTEHMLTPLNYMQECTNKVLQGEKLHNDNYEQCDAFGNGDKEFHDILDSTEHPEDDDDPLSADRLLQRHLAHYCKLYEFASEFYTPVYPGKEQEKKKVKPIDGLACLTNNTLHIVAMDSIRDHHFAESLGIDVLNIKDKTAIVILDTKLETQYMLKKDISAKSIRDFIYDFTFRNLKRNLRSKVEDARNTHYYNKDNDMGENDVVIAELTSKTFRKFINTPKTTSIMCVCGGYCPALVNRAVLSATRMLKSCGVRIQTSKLDALKHDMPWQYTASVYPTIFVFPADRRQRAESKVYPYTRQITSSGIVSLVLHTLPTPQHLRVRLVLCSYEGSLHEKSSCLKDLKQHVTTLINNNLKYWRISSEKNKIIVYDRLHALHRVSFELDFFRVTDLVKGNEKRNSLLDLLDKKSTLWSTDFIFDTTKSDL